MLAPFWAWFDQLSEPERGQVIAPIMNKLRVLTSRAAIRRMLGQAKPRFHLDELFTKRRIVLINLNRRVLGPETSRLLGSLVLYQLVQAIHRRAKVPPAKRRLASVVVDEWQDFAAGLDFGALLAEARGLGVGLVVAHQHLGQLSPNLRAAVLANARSRVAFRPAQDDVKPLAAVLGNGVRAEDLAGLGAYQAAVQLLVEAKVAPTFGVRTLPLGEPTNDADAVKAASRNRYGVLGSEVDEQLRIRWLGGDSAGQGPIGLSRRQP